ncbi:5343_t:CDS:2, partial [Scutellospora calospora]
FIQPQIQIILDYFSESKKVRPKVLLEQNEVDISVLFISYTSNSKNIINKNNKSLLKTEINIFNKTLDSDLDNNSNIENLFNNEREDYSDDR